MEWEVDEILVAGHTLAASSGVSDATARLSPEQSTGSQVVGPSTDTYALGSVRNEMLVVFTDGSAQIHEFIHGWAKRREGRGP